MVEVEIPNNLRNAKFTETVAQIVVGVQSGEIVTISNSGDYAVSTTEAVEAAKRNLAEAGVKVYQANRLEYESVLAPENPEEPLARRKIHHHKIKFVVRLSSKPIDDIRDGESQQLLEPKNHRKSVASG